MYTRPTSKMKVKVLEPELATVVSESIKEANQNEDKEAALNQFELIMAMMGNDEQDVLILERIDCQMQINICKYQLNKITYAEFQEINEQLTNLYCQCQNTLTEQPTLNPAEQRALSCIDEMSDEDDEDNYSQILKMIKQSEVVDKIKNLYRSVYGNEAILPPLLATLFAYEFYAEDENEFGFGGERLKSYIDLLLSLITHFQVEKQADYLLEAYSLIIIFHKKYNKLIESFTLSFLSSERSVELSKEALKHFKARIYYHECLQKEIPIGLIEKYFKELYSLTLIDRDNALTYEQIIVDFYEDKNISKKYPQNEIMQTDQKVKKLLSIHSIYGKAKQNPELNPPKNEQEVNITADLVVNDALPVSSGKRKRSASKGKLTKVTLFSTVAPVAFSSLSREGFYSKYSNMILENEENRYVISELFREIAKYHRYQSDHFHPRQYVLYKVMLELYYASLSIDPHHRQTESELNFYLHNEYSHHCTSDLNLKQIPNPKVEENIKEIDDSHLYSYAKNCLYDYLSSLASTCLDSEEFEKKLAVLDQHLHEWLENNRNALTPMTKKRRVN